MAAENLNLKNYIRSIPDWPKKGILFRDITPLLADQAALDTAIRELCDGFRNANVDYVAAIEARGFIFGAAVAQTLQAGFLPVRKKGKLPYKTETIKYDLEYATDTLEVHKDAASRDANVLMVDDLLATGGTMAASCELLEKIGAKIVGISFLIELTNLKGRDKLKQYRINSVIKY